MAFGVDDILVGVAGNATYDFIKLIVKKYRIKLTKYRIYLITKEYYISNKEE